MKTTHVTESNESFPVHSEVTGFDLDEPTADPHPLTQPEDDLSDVYLSNWQRAAGWRVVGNRVNVADYRQGAFNYRIYNPGGLLIASPRTARATEAAVYLNVPTCHPRGATTR